MKRIVGSTMLIFIMLSLVDFFVHGKLLATVYQETSELWRPMMEMKMGIMHITTLIIALGFSLLYKQFVGCKCALCGTKFGLLLGFIAGVSMGFGSYSYMPIPLGLALAWFFASWIQYTFAGLIAGLIITD